MDGSFPLLRVGLFAMAFLGAVSMALCGSHAGESTTSRPMLIGHRGAAGLAPENTLSAFERACGLGVDGIELDVLVSADGELVVHHDFRIRPEITRGVDGAWVSPTARPAILELTLAQLKSYDVGRLKPLTDYAARYPEQSPSDGQRIPTLREVIGLYRERCREGTRLLVEIKASPEEPGMTPPPEAVADKVIALLRQEGVDNRTLLLSFDWRALVRVQKTAPGIPTVYLSMVSPGLDNIKAGRPGPSPWTAGIDVDDFNGSVPQAVKAAGGRIWAPFFRNLASDSLNEARRLGLQVFVWTPDQPADMKRLIEMQVDGIITNRPDLLKSLLGR
jgi:glycerophosphoryl diester phosphodiesterase